MLRLQTALVLSEVLKCLGCEVAGRETNTRPRGFFLSPVPFISPVHPSRLALLWPWTVLCFYISTIGLCPWVCSLRFFAFSWVSSHCSNQGQKKVHQLPWKDPLLLWHYRQEASSNLSQVATGKANCSEFLDTRGCLSLCVVSVLFLTMRLCSHEWTLSRQSPPLSFSHRQTR